MPMGPATSLSSSLIIIGTLEPISPIMRAISSVRYASWPQPKLPICTSSSSGVDATMTAHDSMRAW